jgi:hypothetical protein
MIKIKINDHIIKFTWEKKKITAKPVNRDNQVYLARLTNWVIDSTKFNNLVFFSKSIFI